MSQETSHVCDRCGSPLAGPDASCASCLLSLGFDSPRSSLSSGDADDRFRIVDTLGEGGMGTVFLAEQTRPIRRQVALKVIKRGMDTREVIDRFAAEQQALALMDHPSIATVFEAGETREGQPFFAMEYIDGPRITDYADRAQLSTRERLEIFSTLCDGVQHAHQKGIIHRDLKPSNVLVARNGVAVPKIIDFGVAKATEMSLTDATMITELGVVVGTPQYMSPEQAELSPLGVDTRSDIYSLGVLLYEMLSGCLPFESDGVGLDELRRRIREDDPSTPSARVKDRTERTTEIATCRRVDVSTLRRQLSGDLDWITMKALEKDPARRYQSAAELAGDVRAYLADQPVSARAPSTSYRLQKFVLRHRLGVAVAGLLLVALVSFAGTMAFQARRIAEERDRANRERDGAERVSTFLADMLGGVEPDEMGFALWADLSDQVAEVQRSRGGDDTRVEAARADLRRILAGVNSTAVARRMLDRDVLSSAGQAVDSRLAEDPATAARLLLTLGNTYRELGLYAEAEPHLRQALALREGLYGRSHLETLETVYALGILLRSWGKHEESETLLQETLDGRRALLGDEHPATLDARSALGALHHAQGRLDEAGEHLEAVLDARRRLLGEDHPDTLRSLNDLGMLLEESGRFEEAETYLRASLDGSRRVLGQDARGTLAAMNNLAVVLDARGKIDESETIYREALESMRRVYGDEHPKVLGAQNNLGALLRSQGRFDEAEATFQDVLEKKRRVLGDEHPSTLVSLNSLGTMLRSRGRLAEAEEVFRETLEIRTRVLGPEHRDTLGAQNNLGHILYRQRKLDEAEDVIVDSLERYRRVLGDSHRDTYIAVQRLAEIREAQGRLLDAERLYAESLDGYRRVLGDENPATINAFNSLGWLHHVQGAYTQAEPYFRDVLRLRRATRPEGHPWIAFALVGLGRNLIAQGLHGEAETLLQEATTIRRAAHREGQWLLAESLALQGAALAGLERWDEAEALLLEALAEDVLPARGRLDRRAEAHGHLVALYEATGRPDQAAEWRARAAGG